MRARLTWALAVGVWVLYGTAALTEGLLVCHPASWVTAAVFGPFGATVDTAYAGPAFGDSLHRGFALVDMLFGPVFCAAAVGLVRNAPRAPALAFACGLTSLALLTVDLLTDFFGQFANVLDPWRYALSIAPYYAVAAATMWHALGRLGREETGPHPCVPVPALRRGAAFVIDAALAVVLLVAAPAGPVLAVLYLVFRDGLAGGRSPGKRVLALQLARSDGGAGSVGLRRSLLRNLLFAIPLVNAALSAAVFEGTVLCLDGGARRLGDRLAGTRVVRA